MIGSDEKKVMILWLALFRVQEKEPMLNSCTFRTEWIQFLEKLSLEFNKEYTKISIESL